MHVTKISNFSAYKKISNLSAYHKISNLNAYHKISNLSACYIAPWGKVNSDDDRKHKYDPIYDIFNPRLTYLYFVTSEHGVKSTVTMIENTNMIHSMTFLTLDLHIYNLSHRNVGRNQQ